MPPDQKPVPLALDLVRTDGGTQARACLNDDVVAEYAEVLMRAGEQAQPHPPVVVFFDGEHYWLADGFHRLAAHRKAGRKQILAEVRQGTRRDAILHAAGANAQHGLRRSNDDKRVAVMRLLTDDEWSKWSDLEISRRCGVSDRFVNKVRAELSPNRSEMRGQAQAPRTVQRGGSVFTMNTSAIGKARGLEGAEAEQILKCKGQAREVCRKLDRHALALGTTTEALVRMYRNGELEPVR